MNHLSQHSSPTPKRIKALIFDMDDVLIDSEIIYLRHQVTKLKPRYPWITEKLLYPLVGSSRKDADAFLAVICHRDINDPEFKTELKQLFEGLRINYSDIMYPEVPWVLKKLKSMHLKLTLASNSGMEVILKVLRECSLNDYFDCLTSGWQLTKSKPDPLIYLVTMTKLGLHPGECLVIEDSKYGIAAGVAAGCTVIALRDTRYSIDQSGADFIIDSLYEIPVIVERLNKLALS